MVQLVQEYMYDNVVTQHKTLGGNQQFHMLCHESDRDFGEFLT